MAYDQKRVVDAIRAFEAGEIVVVTDDDDRENEGDLIISAVESFDTPTKSLVKTVCGFVYCTFAFLVEFSC